MKKLFSVAAVALFFAGISTSGASAKHWRHHHHRANNSSGGMTMEFTPFRGSNAELQGNNGNSGQGSNSLGHIKGGNIGGGK